MMMMEERDWSQLPEDMLIQIYSKHLQTYRFESIQFRSVCPSWRRCVPSLPPTLSSNPIILPLKKKKKKKKKKIDDVLGKLVESTIYLIRPKKTDQSESDSRAWLIKVEEGKSPNVIHLLDVLTRELILSSPKTAPTGLNLLDFEVTGVCKEYIFVPKDKVTYKAKCVDNLHVMVSDNLVQKVVVSSPTCTANNNDFVIMALHSSESLGVFRHGADRWFDIIIDEDSSKSCFSDIIYYQRQFYVVENTGRSFVIDPYTLSTTLVANPIIHGYLEKKRLLESNGELFLVDIYVDEHGPTVRQQQDSYFQRFPIDCKLFKLDEERKLWIEVESLDDRVLLVSDNCSFSIPAMDFSGCKGNCILLLDYFFVADVFFHDIGIFDLDDRTFNKLPSPHSSYLQLFWPPPTWISVPAP